MSYLCDKLSVKKVMEKNILAYFKMRFKINCDVQIMLKIIFCLLKEILN